MGFDEGDFKDGGSNKLIDAIIAWGDLNAIRKRIDEHHAAGADHVCIQVLTADPKGALPMARVARSCAIPLAYARLSRLTK